MQVFKYIAVSAILSIGATSLSLLLLSPFIDSTTTEEPVEIKLNLNTTCLNGVEYYIKNSYRYGYMAVKYDSSGSISLCSK